MTDRDVQDDRNRPEATKDPVIFGPDPFTHERPPIEEDAPTYRARPRWPFLATILILVVVLVGAVSIWVL